MHRFFSSDLSIKSNGLVLAGDEAHHLKNVLRLKPEDQIELFNGKGLLATGRIDSIGKRSASIVIVGKVVDYGIDENPLKITLLQGLLKGGRNEEVIKDSTVLGAANIRFFTSEHTAAKPAGRKKEEQQKKWQRISIEAAKQCGRTIVPNIKGPTTLKEATDGLEAAFKIALFEAETEIGLKQYLKNYRAGSEIAILVGPEGGLSNNDLETIQNAGFHTVRMGPLRLRSEAAARTVLSIIGYALGEMGGLGNR